MSDDSLFARISPIVEAFTAEYEAGIKPDIADYIERADDDARPWLLEDLIRVEHRFHGEDFAGRKDWYLEEFSDFRHEIEVVYREFSIALPGAPTPWIHGPSSGTPVPVEVANYKLLQLIGNGGMGRVWMAEQQRPVVRRVALKVIHEQFRSKELIARFEAERQALAMMNHPNIAKVLDGGTTNDGSPFFAMEYVRGIPFSAYCDKNRLSLRERLALFVPVCRAIQHAHQKSIIHRDIKPANVLVTFSDDGPVPKIIDFGLVKGFGPKLTDRTMVTQVGQVLGTLRYMSPEQADSDCLDIDTRTDIYSLGVMLYELLTGSTPIDGDRLGSHERMLSMIREVDPPRPSTRLGSSDNHAEISKLRCTDFSRLNMILRGDLDWIVMKAIEKDRTRRYDTASALAEDVERFLNNEPISARPPSQLYRIRKMVRRNRSACIASALVLASLLTSLGVFIHYHYRLRSTQGSLAEATHRLENVSADLNSAKDQLGVAKAKVGAANAQVNSAIALGERYEQAARDALANRDQARQDASNARIAQREAEQARQETIETAAKELQQMLAEVTVLKAAGAQALREKQLSDQQATQARRLATRYRQDAEMIKLILTHGVIGQVDPNEGGEAALDAENTSILTVLGRTSDKVQQARATAETMELVADLNHALSFAFLEYGKHELAKIHVEQAYALRKELYKQASPEQAGARRVAWVDAAFNLAKYQQQAGQLDSAKEWLDWVLNKRTRFETQHPLEIMHVQNALAHVWELKSVAHEASGDMELGLETRFRCITVSRLVALKRASVSEDDTLALPLIEAAEQRLERNLMVVHNHFANERDFAKVALTLKVWVNVFSSQRPPAEVRDRLEALKKVYQRIGAKSKIPQVVRALDRLPKDAADS